MSEKLSSSTIAAYVRRAAHDVFSTMLNLPLEDREAFDQSQSDAEGKSDGVQALVGIAGSWTGTGRICCSSQFACQLAGALLMSEYSAPDEDVLDAVAEVANMIIGNVKTYFEEELGPLCLGVPTVIFGRNYRTRSIGVPSWVVVPFESAGHAWEVRFCLMPNRTTPAPARPVLPQADVLHSA